MRLQTCLQVKAKVDAYVELLQEIFFLFQHVDAATREGNILDLVISNEISMVEDVKILEHFSTSDHNMVMFPTF